MDCFCGPRAPPPLAWWVSASIEIFRLGELFLKVPLCSLWFSLGPLPRLVRVIRTTKLEGLRLARRHARPNPSPSQSRRNLISNLKASRILHELPLRIEQQRVSPIQNGHRRKRLQALGPENALAPALRH